MPSGRENRRLERALAAAALLACGCSRTEPVFRGAPVILISIDTLRAVHLQEGWSYLVLLDSSGGKTTEFAAALSEMTRRVPTAAGFEATARVCETVGYANGVRFWRRRGHEVKTSHSHLERSSEIEVSR